MDNEEIQGVKFSEFPSATPGNSDEVVGLHSGDNARFTIANIVAAVRNGLANIFVPKTDVGSVNGVASLDNTGKVPTSQLPSSTGPEPATVTPLMDGTGAVGASTKYAREDHEHPADTNKQNKITANGILKGDGQGGVSAATAGTDYATPAQLADKANLGQIGYPETGTTASRNYTAGEYICWNGLTYTADTNIVLGTTLSASGGSKNLTQVNNGGLNDLEYYRPSESFSITGCYMGVSSNSNNPPVRVYIQTRKKIRASGATFSGTVNWIRASGNSDYQSVVTSVTVTNETLLELRIAPSSPLALASLFGVYITGTITLNS